MDRPPLRVGIAVVVHDGCYLIGVRPEGKSLAGYSEFPGGKCEPGETAEDCAIRECLEETGLTVVTVEEILQHQYRYPHGQLDLSFWRCRIPENLAAEPQHGFRWVPAEELFTLQFPEANAPLIARLRVEAAQRSRSLG